MTRQEILNQINKYQDLLAAAKTEKEQNFVQKKINEWEYKLEMFDDEQRRKENERIENQRKEKERLEKERIQKEEAAKKKKKEFKLSDDFLDTDSMVEEHQANSKKKASILKRNKYSQ